MEHGDLGAFGERGGRELNVREGLDDGHRRRRAPLVASRWRGGVVGVQMGRGERRRGRRRAFCSGFSSRSATKSERKCFSRARPRTPAWRARKDQRFESNSQQEPSRVGQRTQQLASPLLTTKPALRFSHSHHTAPPVSPFLSVVFSHCYTACAQKSAGPDPDPGRCQRDIPAAAEFAARLRHTSQSSTARALRRLGTPRLSLARFCRPCRTPHPVRRVVADLLTLLLFFFFVDFALILGAT